MNKAKGHITTQNGVISVEYVKDGGKARIKVFADPKIEASFEYNGKSTAFSGEAEFEIEV